MPSQQALQKLVSAVYQKLREQQVTIAVLGDMILDNAIEGVPSGVHPETTVPIMREATSQESIGGAGNIALALARLGAEVVLFGIIGSDLPGRQLENLLDRQSFSSNLVHERGWPTPRKDWIYQRQAGRINLVLRIDYDRPLGEGAREELVGEFRARCPANANVVVLADHGLGSIGDETLPVIQLARERQAPVVAIPRTNHLRGQALSTIVINAAEMRRWGEAADNADPRTLAASYAREYSQNVSLSLLEEGIFACSAGKGQGTLVEGYPLQNPQWMGVRDITTAMLALGLALKLDFLDSARVANVCRHLVACQRGNGRVLWRDIFGFVGLETPRSDEL